MDAKSVRCLEFRGGRFSEVANVLHKRDFQSVTATLSAIGSVSASRSVRPGKYYCSSFLLQPLLFFIANTALCIRKNNITCMSVKV